MTIAIASSGATLEDQVDARFGRCPYFLIVDPEKDNFQAVKNTAGQAFQGAGISAAQMIANKKVKAVIAGNFGPKAVSVLNASGIEILAGVFGITAQQALEKYKAGELKTVEKSNFPPGIGFSGMGKGRGRGMGRGCGWDKGRNQ